jgi:hypothetical protein
MDLELRPSHNSACDYYGSPPFVKPCTCGLDALYLRLADVSAKYHELILAVGNIHQGETRHQTALRYILEAEAWHQGQEAATEIPQS